MVTNKPIKKYFHKVVKHIELKNYIFDTWGNTGKINKAYKLFKYFPKCIVDVIYKV